MLTTHVGLIKRVLFLASCASLAAPFFNCVVGDIPGYALLIFAVEEFYQSLAGALWLAVFFSTIVMSVLELKLRNRFVVIVHGFGIAFLSTLVLHGTLRKEEEFAWGFWLFIVLSLVSFLTSVWEVFTKKSDRDLKTTKT